jgi:ferric-dicitrate binding protein FerR (iron transport regulator)
MEPRVHSFDEELLIAEHAAEWLLRVQAADAREMERLLEWLCRSPQNAGELLAATSMDLAMRQFFQNRPERIDVDQLLASSVNVLTIRDHALQAPVRAAAGKRSRIFAAASLGIAATTVALVVTPTPVRSWLHACEYGAPVGEQRVIDLQEGSAVAIHAGSGILVLFAANARDVYADVGLPMFASVKGPTRPFRVRVIPSTSEGANATEAPLIRAAGSNDVLRRLDRIAQNTGVVAPPLAIALPSMNPWDDPIIVERRGNEVLIR